MSAMKKGTKGTHKHTEHKARTGAYAQMSGTRTPKSDRRSSHSSPEMTMSNHGKRTHASNSTAGNTP